MSGEVRPVRDQVADMCADRGQAAWDVAGDILSLPVIAEALAAQERVTAALALADEWERRARRGRDASAVGVVRRSQMRVDARALRRTLTGEA